ncbi:hypothetical protein EON81_04615 [bacterium]|nr:MAG: hypothetical protein EON81_04615 [bacterium]
MKWFRQPIPATEDLPVEFKGIRKLVQLLDIWDEINSSLSNNVGAVDKEFAAVSSSDELRSAVSDLDRLLAEDPFRIGEVSHSLGRRFYTIEEGKACLVEWREALAHQEPGAGDAAFVPLARDKIGMQTELVIWRVPDITVSV